MKSEGEEILTPRAKKPSKRFIGLVALCFVAVLTALAGEVVIQIAAFASPNIKNKIFPYSHSLHRHSKDPILGVRGNPAFSGHDAHGYRNPVVLDRAEIVAIGDSHTYGTSVADEDAWTRRLAERLGVNVYNMAHGGYGPVHYARLIEEAIALAPKTVLIGIYFGNDFYDNWTMHDRESSRYPLATDLLSQAQAREEIRPLAEEVFEFFTMGAEHEDAHKRLRGFLSRNSGLYGFLRAIKNATFSRSANVLDPSFETAGAALTQKQLEYASIFNGRPWRTIFTARYRFAVEDASDPRILVGRWMATRAAATILEQSQAKGFDVVFLLLPTKESVFAERVTNPSAHPYFTQLVADEAEHRRALIEYLQKNSAPYIDLTPALRGAERQPYFENADGHPNELGHEIIAETVAKALRARLLIPASN